MADREILDKRHLLHAGAVLVALHLHFEVVGERPTHGSRLSGAHRAENTVLEIGVFALLNLTALSVLVRAVVAPERRTEIGRRAERNRRGEHVANHLHLVAENFERHIEAIQLSVERNRPREVEHVVEIVGSVHHHLSRRVGVPSAANLACVHAVVER